MGGHRSRGSDMLRHVANEPELLLRTNQLKVKTVTRLESCLGAAQGRLHSTTAVWVTKHLNPTVQPRLRSMIA